jgi:hypothetical protein
MFAKIITNIRHIFKSFDQIARICLFVCTDILIFAQICSYLHLFAHTNTAYSNFQTLALVCVDVSFICNGLLKFAGVVLELVHIALIFTFASI